MKLEADFVFFFSKGNKISVCFVKLIHDLDYWERIFWIVTDQIRFEEPRLTRIT